MNHFRPGALALYGLRIYRLGSGDAACGGHSRASRSDTTHYASESRQSKVSSHPFSGWPRRTPDVLQWQLQMG